MGEGSGWLTVRGRGGLVDCEGLGVVGYGAGGAMRKSAEAGPDYAGREQSLGERGIGSGGEEIGGEEEKRKKNERKGKQKFIKAQ